MVCVSQGEVLEHFGMCDASASVALNSTLFMVANDEDNVLRVYDRERSGNPLYSQDISDFLIPESRTEEADIEGATYLDGKVFWITSHGLNRKGKKKPSRHQFFATEVTADHRVIGIGRPYTQLQEDLCKADQLSPYKLKKAAKIPPKEPGGFNIEGLCATPDRRLLIGFRNPIPGDKALMISLENPFAVIEGHPAQFGQPLELDLDGLGIRSVEYWPERGTYLIAAGPFDGAPGSHLYWWSGQPCALPVRLTGMDFGDLNPESVITYPGERSHVQILSDDGMRLTDGIPCKKLPEVHKRRFRSAWLTYPEV